MKSKIDLVRAWLKKVNTPYAVEIRYPLLIQEPPEEKTKELLRIAIKIKELVLNKLPLGKKDD